MIEFTCPLALAYLAFSAAAPAAVRCGVVDQLQALGAVMLSPGLRAFFDFEKGEQVE